MWMLLLAVTWCALPSVSRAVVRGGLRNGRLVWRPYLPGNIEKQRIN